MLLCGVYEVEEIRVHPDDDPHSSHYISIVTDKDVPKFSVTSCCDEEWVWDFWYSKTNYDIVKHLVMDCVFSAETMDDLIDALDEVFEEYCSEIIFEEHDNDDCDVELECDGNCETCVFYED